MQSMIFALAWFVSLQTLPLQASAIPVTSLLPGRNELPNRPDETSQVRQAIHSCFAAKSADDFPSGYARLKVLKGKLQPSLVLERSTYQDSTVENCLVLSLNRLKKAYPGDDSWSYVHVVSDCMAHKNNQVLPTDDIQCETTVLLNKVAENKALKETNDDHWNTRKSEANRTFYTAAKLIHMINALDKVE